MCGLPRPAAPAHGNPGAASPKTALGLSRVRPIAPGWRGAVAWPETRERGARAPMTVLGSRMSAGRVAASAITRVTQLGLVALGCGLAFFSASAGSDLGYLIGWDLLVGCYLAIGFTIARHRRTRLDSVRPVSGVGRMLTSARLSFGFAVLASLVGVSSLTSALSYGGNATYGHAIKLFGGAAIIAAWLLLHAG